MRVLDSYWTTNKDWWHYDENDKSLLPKRVINDDAPREAKESYARFLEQMNEDMS